MKDLLLDITDFDLLIENGDFRLGDSLYQETKLIMETAPGQWRDNPIIGLDLERWINDEMDINAIKTALKQQLKLDKKRLKSFSVVGENFQIDVERL